MTVSTELPSTVDVTAGPRSDRFKGIAAMLISAASNQTGAATGAHAFGAIGPIGVVAVRQVVAAAVLLPVARPDLRRLTWAQWWPCLALAGVFVTMNLSLATAVERIGLGLAVTLEFLGPLAVALAGSRGIREIALAVLAGVGVYVLVLPGPTSDLIGVGLALLAAGLWAAYILVNKLVGRRLPGVQAPAVASLLAASFSIPVLIWLAVDGRLWGPALLMAVAAGLLSSAVPYAADLTALRFVPARYFGVFMSAHPVLAALAGWVILGQLLDFHEWLGIGIIVLANAIATVRIR